MNPESHLPQDPKQPVFQDNLEVSPVNVARLIEEKRGSLTGPAADQFEVDLALIDTDYKGALRVVDAAEPTLRAGMLETLNRTHQGRLRALCK